MCPKLQRCFKGPFRILERVSDVLYRVQLERGGGSESILHFDRMKPYVACSVLEPVGENVRSPTEGQTTKQYPKVWQSTKEGYEPTWGYY